MRHMIMLALGKIPIFRRTFSNEFLSLRVGLRIFVVIFGDLFCFGKIMEK